MRNKQSVKIWDYELEIKFWIKIYITCQILKWKNYNESDFE